MASPAILQISLKNSELKTTHNTFRDCRVHFFRQPFSKQLYGKNKGQGFLTVYEEMSSRQIRETRASDPERDLNLGTPNWNRASLNATHVYAYFSAHSLVFVPSKILQNLNVFYLSSVLLSPQAEKLKAMLMQNLGRRRHGRCASGEQLCLKQKYQLMATSWQSVKQ